MANVIKLRKGLDINLKGKAAKERLSVKEPGFYSLVPDDFTGVTPKVVVKEQEYVMAGGPLFIDKNHPEVKFVSPVSGVVTSVERGAKRKLMNIVVEAAAEQDYEEFGKMDPAKMDGEQVKEALLNAGMFAFIRQRPYDVIANPEVKPKAIFVSAFDTNPLAPDFEFVLKGEEANFQTGLDALSRMAKTYLSISVNQSAPALTNAKNVTITAFDGTLQLANAQAQEPLTTGMVTARDHGTIAGEGYAGSISVYKGGVLTAGNDGGCGTITALGNVTMYTGSTLMVKIQRGRFGGRNNDKFDISGRLAHSNDTLLVKVQQGVALQPGDEFEVFVGDGKQAGSYTLKTECEGYEVVWDDSRLKADGVLTVATVTSVGGVTADEGTVSVYSTDGKLLRDNVPSDRALDGLAPGVYIVGGEKAIKE